MPTFLLISGSVLMVLMTSPVMAFIVKSIPIVWFYYILRSSFYLFRLNCLESLCWVELLYRLTLAHLPTNQYSI